ncbi:Na(+)/H(+) antiporter subunit C [Siminovitchia fortis]|uniref:Na(+)/H(+) antiporter subunit C n=1 Tax=Siminovitchia fortis TaxID=254758 RepID=UPI0011A0218F|nr:Na(+)/H(+) antiporter subunit C [Siminovitchia fortis]
MEILITILSGVLVTAATYLILSKDLLRVILGSAILSHAVHLLLMVMGGLKKGTVPLLGEKPNTYTDAIPQALILTAIVISFAVTAVFLVMAYRMYQETGVSRHALLRGNKNE